MQYSINLFAWYNFNNLFWSTIFNKTLQALGGVGEGGTKTFVGRRNYHRLLAIRHFPTLRASLNKQWTLFPPDDTDNPILGLWLLDYYILFTITTCELNKELRQATIRQLLRTLGWLHNSKCAFYSTKSPSRLKIIARTNVKVAQDPCSHYVCIYLKSMHEQRRLKPKTNEIFMRIFFLQFFVQVITRYCS